MIIMELLLWKWWKRLWESLDTVIVLLLKPLFIWNNEKFQQRSNNLILNTKKNQSNQEFNVTE